MSGNGIRCLAWVAARAGLGTERRADRRHRGGSPRHRRSTRDAAGDVVAADVDMGAGHPRRRRTSSVIGRRRRSTGAMPPSVGQSAPRVLRRSIPPLVPVTSHGPRLELDARFPKRTNVEFVRVHPPDVHRHAGVGTRRGRDAVVRHRRVRGGRGRTEPGCRRRAGHACTSPAASSQVTLGATVRLGGPVVHVFDVDVDLDGAALRRREADLVTELVARSPEPSAPAPHRDRGRSRRVRQQALLVGTGLRHRHGRGGRGVARRARAARRHRGRRAGPLRAATPAHARPRHLHRQGQGRGAARSSSRPSTSTS